MWMENKSILGPCPNFGIDLVAQCISNRMGLRDDLAIVVLGLMSSN
jgi:hypothetical protein